MGVKRPQGSCIARFLTRRWAKAVQFEVPSGDVQAASGHAAARPQPAAVPWSVCGAAFNAQEIILGVLNFGSMLVVPPFSYERTARCDDPLQRNTQHSSWGSRTIPTSPLLGPPSRSCRDRRRFTCHSALAMGLQRNSSSRPTLMIRSAQQC